MYFLSVYITFLKIKSPSSNSILTKKGVGLKYVNRWIQHYFGAICFVI